MIDILFEINGRKVSSRQFPNELEKAVAKGIRDKLTRAVGNIRDPMTGKSPKLKVTGRSLDKFSIKVEGSSEVISEVERRLAKNW